MLTALSVFLLSFAAFPQQTGGDWSQAAWFVGEFEGDFFGSSVAYTSDIDDDGVADVVVGADRASLVWYGEPWGKAYVYSGAWPSPLLFTWQGEYKFSFFGESVADAGDVDQDGKTDFLVGAPGGYSPGDIGVVFVYSGLDGTMIHRLEGNLDERFGSFVKGLGDIDLDGYADFLIGAERANTFGTQFGAARVYSGRNGVLLYELGGPWWGNGRSGDTLGDVNQDGHPDFILGDGKDGGSVALYSGADGSVIHRWYESFGINGNFGVAVASVHDVDGDSIHDFMVGANEAGRWGRAFLYSTLTRQLLHVFKPDYDPNVQYASFGSSVGGTGDVNGDGINDFLVSDESFNFYSHGSGAVIIFSGFDGSRIELQTAYRNGGFVPSAIGECIDGSEDTTGDGIPDILACADRSDASWVGTDCGAVLRLTFRSWLSLSPREISAPSGGTVVLRLEFPRLNERNRDYVLLASSDRPGRSGGHDFLLPLVQSPILHRMYANPPINFDAPTGTLDANGEATINLTLAPGEASAAVGRTFKFSAITLNSNGQPRLASAGVILEVLP